MRARAAAPRAPPQAKSKGREKRIQVHGILMAVAWVGMVPLGSLAARHK